MIAYFDNVKSPNCSDRHGTIIDTIVIHHTDGSLESTISWFRTLKSKVSAHVVIARNGDIHSMVDLKYKAWHCGESHYDYNGDGKIVDNEYSLNARSIGVELESDGETYTVYQLTALTLLCLQWMHLYSISASQILGHKEIAPERKIDPGNFNMDLFRNSMQALYNVRAKVVAE